LKIRIHQTIRPLADWLKYNGFNVGPRSIIPISYAAPITVGELPFPLVNTFSLDDSARRPDAPRNSLDFRNGLRAGARR
jgi:hypothetical protein